MTHDFEHLSAERIQAFLDGELSQAEMALVQAHSASCARCQAEIEAWGLLFEELEELPPLEPSAGLANRVIVGLPERVPAGLGGSVAGPPSVTGDHLTPEVFQDRVEGRIPAAGDAHLASCGNCRQELATWQAVFAGLEDLERLAPSANFAERVMAALPQRAPVGLFHRLRGGSARTETHPVPDVMQALVSGTLAGRDKARTESHLAACGDCRDELAGWQGMFSELEGLAQLAPAGGFSDRVMAQVDVRSLVPAARKPLAARMRAWANAWAPRDAGKLLPAWAGSLVPRTKRAWALVASVAAAPTVAVAALAATLFSNPLLTPQYLASYLWWKMSGAAFAVVGSLWTLGLEVSESLRGYALVEAAAGSATGLAVTGTALTVLMATSLWIVYRNLFAPSVTARHARISS